MLVSDEILCCAYESQFLLKIETIKIDIKNKFHQK